MGQNPYPNAPQPGPGWPNPGYPAQRTGGGGTSAQDVTSGLLLIAGGLLAAVGGFLPGFKAVYDGATGGATAFTSTVTNWTYKSGTPGHMVTRVAISGVPLGVASALALVVGLLLLVGLGRRSNPVRAIATAGSAFLFATAVLAALNYVDALRFSKPDATTGKFEPGFWLITAATVASLVATVLALMSPRPAAPSAGWNGMAPQQAPYPYANPAPHQYVAPTYAPAPPAQYPQQQWASQGSGAYYPPQPQTAPMPPPQPQTAPLPPPPPTLPDFEAPAAETTHLPSPPPER
jgi:hypothetical protein